MVDEVVLLQGLLDQEQVEPVEFGEGVGVSERVRGVGVHLQRDIAEGIPNGGGVGDVAAGLDLDLDADVPLVEVSTDGVDQSGGVALDADAHTRGHAVADRAEVLSERSPLGAQRGIEYREFEPRFRHPVPDKGFQDGGDVFGGESVPIQQRGDEKAQRHVPRALRVLARVQRRLLRDDLTPAVPIGSQRPRDDDLAHRLGAEGCRERRDER